MHLTKKQKLILAWGIPSVVLVAATSIAAVTIIVVENTKHNKIDSAGDFTPIPFNSSNSFKPSYDPSRHDINYFVYKIASTPLVNEFFSFENENLHFDKDSGEWTSNSGVKYKILNVEISEDANGFVVNNGNYLFNVEIAKSFESLTKTYKRTILVPESTFVTTEMSYKNFVNDSTAKILEMFSSQQITFFAENELHSTVNDIVSANDLGLLSKQVSNSDVAFTKQNDQNNNIFYGTASEQFAYLTMQNVKFTTPIEEAGTKLVLNSTDAYSFNPDGTFNQTSPLFTFLMSKWDRLLYKPELTQAEINECTVDGVVDETKVKEKTIQKLIFNPALNSYSFDAIGNKIPLSNYQAVVVKVELGNLSTYIVTWSNLFAATGSVVETAEEIPFKVLEQDGVELTYEQMQNPKYFGFFKPTSTPAGGLIYKVTGVEFGPEDTYKKTAIVTIEISHPDVLNSKTYTVNITQGFKSKAYVELEQGIKGLLNSSQTLDPLKPNVVIKNDKTKQDVFEAVYDLGELSNLLDFESTIPNAKFTINSANIVDNNMIITLKISSINDINKYWTDDSSTVQLIEVMIPNILEGPSTP